MVDLVRAELATAQAERAVADDRGRARADPKSARRILSDSAR